MFAAARPSLAHRESCCDAQLNRYWGVTDIDQAVPIALDS
jgi:hypothetical protein